MTSQAPPPLQLLLLLLLSLACVVLAKDLPHPSRPAAPPLVVPDADVEVQEVATRDMRGEDTTDADLETIYKENLAVDLSVWQNRRLNMSHLWDLRELAHEKDHVGYFKRMVLIKDNTLYYLGDYQTTNLTHNINDAHTFWRTWETAFNGHWRQRRAVWPDVVFLLSMDDPSMCMPKGAYNRSDTTLHAGTLWWDCPAPPFTIFKRPEYADILLPSVLHHDTLPQFRFPWAKKKDVAIFRGTFHCELHQHHRDMSKPIWSGCARLFLANWTFHGPPTHGGKLDVGLISGYGYASGELAPNEVPGCIPPATFIPLKHQARYKWLLALDGHTAPNRFGNIMHVNSVILKQKSDFIEWFYRSMHPGKHYLHIWDTSRTDLVEVMKAWEGRDAELQAIVAAANNFGEHYTSGTARMRYTIKALVEYKRLFPDMDAAIKEYIWPAVQKQLALSKTGPGHDKLSWAALMQAMRAR